MRQQPNGSFLLVIITLAKLCNKCVCLRQVYARFLVIVWEEKNFFDF